MKADAKLLKGLQDNIVRARLADIFGDDIADKFMTLFSDIDKMKSKEKKLKASIEGSNGKAHAKTIELLNLFYAHCEIYHPDFIKRDPSSE